MGSLTSRPSLPPVQQPLFIAVPSPAPLPSASPPADNPAPAASGVEKPAAEQEAENRGAGLLSRSRGRLGTVLTGFRGILSPNNPSYKTLLGE